MTTLDGTKETPAGRFAVEVELANDEDLIMKEMGLLRSDEVRRMRVRGMVDTRATRLVIPQSIADSLGLNIAGTTVVQYANHGTIERAVADRLRLSCDGRNGLFSAIVEPAREAPLVGSIVLEDLDFMVDPLNERLVPRDPNGPVYDV